MKNNLLVSIGVLVSFFNYSNYAGAYGPVRENYVNGVVTDEYLLIRRNNTPVYHFSVNADGIIRKFRIGGFTSPIEADFLINPGRSVELRLPNGCFSDCRIGIENIVSVNGIRPL